MPVKYPDCGAIMKQISALINVMDQRKDKYHYWCEEESYGLPK